MLTRGQGPSLQIPARPGKAFLQRSPRGRALWTSAEVSLMAGAPWTPGPGTHTDSSQCCNVNCTFQNYSTSLQNSVVI